MLHCRPTHAPRCSPSVCVLQGGFLVQLYQNFVAGFAHKINLLKLAFFAVAVGKQMASPEVRM